MQIDVFERWYLGPDFEHARAGGDERGDHGWRVALQIGRRRDNERPVYRRERLRAGHRLSGPAIVEQMDSTTVMLGGQEAVVDERANLVIHVGAA